MALRSMPLCACKPIIKKVRKEPLAAEVSGLALVPILSARAFPACKAQITTAASWNPENAYNMAQVCAYETRASSIPWNFSPVLDLGLDPRFPRQFETDLRQFWSQSNIYFKIVYKVWIPFFQNH